mmetsp:Transcript_67137/g.176033  ORF Transcript_67137/g.176033 Transcript_67137/m.176033 type:complete len:206 (-) Transcript_67137:103-720(-)
MPHAIDALHKAIGGLGLRVVRDHGRQAAHHPRVALLVGLHGVVVRPVVVLGHHLVRRPEEHAPEEVDGALEALHEGHARKDEDRPEDDGAQDAPLEHRPLVRRLDAEAPEDEGDDHEVVHAQTLLDQVARQEDEADLGPLGDREVGGKGQSEAQPRQAGVHSPPDVMPLHLLPGAPGEVQGQCDADDDGEAAPQGHPGYLRGMPR